MGVVSIPGKIDAIYFDLPWICSIVVYSKAHHHKIHLNWHIDHAYTTITTNLVRFYEISISSAPKLFDYMISTKITVIPPWTYQVWTLWCTLYYGKKNPKNHGNMRTTSTSTMGTLCFDILKAIEVAVCHFINILSCLIYIYVLQSHIVLYCYSLFHINNLLKIQHSYITRI